MLKYYLIFIGVMSLITLILYGADKAKAKKHSWRIKEAVLLLFGLFGGALGGLIGMEVFRHKTKHWYFWAVNILGLAIHVALALLIFFKLK
jgi:uncharacterized membrane protein YsdA (DUF1294 family)